MYKVIDNKVLDRDQLNIVTNESKHLLVVAGAGSGKTLTILGKIIYLIEEKNIDPSEILCLSFTKASSLSLKQKLESILNYPMNVYTFHKLSLEILKQTQTFEITDSNTLSAIITEFFNETIFNYPKLMKTVLNYFYKYPVFNIESNYKKILKSNDLTLLKKELESFIHLFKCNNNTLKDFINYNEKIKSPNIFKYLRNKQFLIIVINIYLSYESYLTTYNEYDFDDLIIKATNKVKEKYTTPLKYIIIDEYQDTSYIRFLLIKEILAKTNANLLVVGDDFQSIYKFTGCDISLFLNFTKFFPNSTILKITNTYRTSQELISIASNFIMRNPHQIKKNLHSNKSLPNPLKIIYYKNIKESFKEVIKILPSNILVLGRNNKDIYKLLDNDIILQDNNVIYKEDSTKKITYLTIHKSKGLEATNVIIINLENNILGLPSKIANKSIFDLITLNKEIYPYAEERRLFYVALTRTKNYVYLLVPKYNESIFIKEIKNITNTP